MKLRTSILLLLLSGALGTVLFVLLRPRDHAPAAASVPPPPMTNDQSPNPRLHPVIARIVREGPEMPYLKFNYLIKDIPVTLADCDVAALLAFIRRTPPGAFAPAQWASLVNDIEEALTVQTVPRPAVAEALVAIHRDPSTTPMLRDYALQHIGGMAIFLVHTSRPDRGDGILPSAVPAASRRKAPPHSPPTPNDQSPNDQSPNDQLTTLLLSELLSAASDHSLPEAGTALNLLDGLLRAAEYRAVEIPGLDPAALAALAMPVARDASAPLNARLPALQVAARRNAPAAPGLARAILSEPEPHIMLAQSAAAVLGHLGSPGDIPLLEQLAADGGPHRAPAARAAIAKIRSRRSEARSQGTGDRGQRPRSPLPLSQISVPARRPSAQ